MIEEEILNKLPKELVTTVNLYHTVDGHEINYQIQFTVFGEVLSVENDFDELPDAAKKLIFGNKNLDTFSNKVLRYEQLKYIIPIMAMGGMNILPEWLPPIVSVLQKMQKNIPDSIRKDPNLYISSPWVRDLMKRAKSIQPEESIVSLHFERILIRKSLALSVQMLSEPEQELAIPILVDILEQNIYDDQLAPAIIRGLGRCKSKAVYELILKIFSSQKYSKKLWKAAQQALVRMTTIRNIPPLYDVLWSPDYKKRLVSIDALADFVDEKDVENMLLRVLKYDDHHQVKVEAINALISKKDNPQFLELLTEEMKSGHDERVRYAAVQALKRMNNDGAQEVLKQYYYGY